MSVAQYQRTVNTLDKEIAELEIKKAAADKKAADAKQKAARVLIGKNDSVTTVNSKMRQKENYENTANKALTESADLSKKIADKRKKRNDASARLQKEQQNEQKKQDITTKRIQQSYERQIRDLQAQIETFVPVPHAPMHMSPVSNNEYMNNDMTEPEYDVFVSHASEDKEDFVDEFVEALRNLKLKVWYDTSAIKWGDSMREKIDKGLRKSRFGVVVLSPNYIADGKYWTKAELDGLFQLESINGKIILPIWHHLTKKEVMDYSPIIANKLAMTTATMTPQEIAEKLKEILDE